MTYERGTCGYAEPKYVGLAGQILLLLIVEMYRNAYTERT